MTLNMPASGRGPEAVDLLQEELARWHASPTGYRLALLESFCIVLYLGGCGPPFGLEVAARQLIDLSEDAGYRRGVFVGSACRAGQHYAQYELAEAISHLNRIEANGYFEHFWFGYIYLIGASVAFHAAGDRERRDRMLRRAADAALSANATARIADIDALRAVYAYLDGDLVAVREWLSRQNPEMIDASSFPLVLSVTEVYLCLLVWTGTPAECERAIEWINARLNSPLYHLQRRHAKLLLWRAVAKERSNRPETVLDDLEAAVNLLRPARAICELLPEGRGIVPLLHRLAAKYPDDAFLNEVLDKAVIQYGNEIPAATPSPVARVRQASERCLAHPLSERESEVLRFLAEALPQKAIAHRLGISLITLKSHCSHLYRKLGVASRREAVHQARHLGLLPEA
jgi:DNA-binding CsgD family transcriptional regulator